MIATKQSWIGMAGPAMIEGGGLGVYDPKEIGPAEEQYKNGVLDYLAEDEKEATFIAKNFFLIFKVLSANSLLMIKEALRNVMPEDRRYTYEVRDIIQTLADEDSFLELRKNFGQSIVTGFIRIEGKPFALLSK